jgi:hypothetical protein
MLVDDVPGLDAKLTGRYGLAILRVVLGIAITVHGPDGRVYGLNEQREGAGRPG